MLLLPINTYESSLNKLDRLTMRYRRQDVLHNQYYQDLCERQRDSCQIFQPHYDYQSVFIHRQTSHGILTDLVELASQTYYFTIDTQHQVEPYPWAHSSIPALIQIEFHTMNRASLVIFLEVLFMKSMITSGTRDPVKERKMKQLCQMIFAPNKHVFAWGNVKEKLAPFYHYQLFDSTDLDQVQTYNIHDYFTHWYKLAYPLSMLHRERTNDQRYSLQSALFLVSNQWLNTRMKFAMWNCGIDTSLKTYHHCPTTSSRTNIHQYQWIREEIDYRQHMQTYALHTCFAITQLTYLICQQWSLLHQRKMSPFHRIHYRRKKTHETFV